MILTKIIDFVKAHFYDIILFIIVALLVMLSFATGYITAKYQSKEPIQIKTSNSKLQVTNNIKILNTKF
ncbi:MAG: hypothetical protein A2998_02225 [Candidatus Staskawiczbacteria bacterium RIFCSPLOWO2_01_FULL_37_25b]|uniref:Uncharacterized protein n=2 Tax=Candidatus Staskawicziibacteriota TaxID=1817916 RepID=A0A1G2HRL3_9BACT|nr:MAG: hypothetical protein A2812_01210 [Candidatus Staskawiczbacteria bacterium RIFCSPHIGHO2_01_FULL_36_16]OGZ74714.1 MAG: hypothetical protein A2998_02225 [Candidatus Staskawiczbacteria bacterium RIFCSPLOWO2_01_FULL_37_25b]